MGQVKKKKEKETGMSLDNLLDIAVCDFDRDGSGGSSI